MPKLPGTVVDRVKLDIDYHIIQRFSRHLYGSANKAVEELVSNGFDAYAHRLPNRPSSVRAVLRSVSISTAPTE